MDVRGLLNGLSSGRGNSEHLVVEGRLRTS